MYQQLRDLRLEGLEVDSVSSQVDTLMQLTRRNGEDKYCSRRDKFMEVGLFIRGGLKFKQGNGWSISLGGFFEATLHGQNLAFDSD